MKVPVFLDCNSLYFSEYASLVVSGGIISWGKAYIIIQIKKPSPDCVVEVPKFT